MVLADQVLGRVFEDGRHLRAHVEHAPLEVELDHRHRALDRRHHALEVGVAAPLLGDVGGELDDLDQAAIGVHHRVVGGLQPDVAAEAVDALELAGAKAPLAQTAPELRIGRGADVGLLAEHQVVAADHLIERVVEHAQEVVVGVQHPPGEVELDHRLRQV